LIWKWNKKKKEEGMRVKTGMLQSEVPLARMIFRFEVRLLSGPVTQSFIDRNPELPSRVIDIRGSQTLEDLHDAIYMAFDRDDEHMYEFQFGGRKPMDRKAVRYTRTPYDMDDDPEKESAETVVIAGLNLKKRSRFFYWFDFGDDWWHEVRLLAVNAPEKGGECYPRIVESKGDSPPQYADWEEEEEGGSGMAEDAVPQGANAALKAGRIEEISALIKDFCKARLTESYAEVCERLLMSAYGKWRLPLERGKAQGWAAGVVHAAGMINFLHDPASEPHMKLGDIAPHFGISPATMANKSRVIREAGKISPLDPRFCLPEMVADNPLVWFKQVNGIIVDLRTQPLEVQQAALKAGMIPYIPEPPAEPALPARKKKNKP
jgi:hypothetical protein